MISGAQEEAFKLFSQAAYSGEVLDSRTTHLIKLAAAMAIGCYP